MPNFTYEQCYQLLGIHKNCNWNEARKAYKSLIQKSHPDRFTNDSEKQAEAVEKIKEFNKAYKILEGYYKTHNKLPDPDFNSPNNIRKKNWKNNNQNEKNKEFSQASAAKPSRKPEPFIHPSREYSETGGYKSLVLAFYVLILLPVIGSGLVFLLFEQTTSTALNDKNTSIQVKEIENDHNDRINSVNAPPPKKPTHLTFTVGSTIGEVISAQGEPSHTKGDIWFYGKSIVYFKDGVVIKWERHADSPLNAGFNSKLQFSKETEKTKDDNHTKNWFSNN